MRRDFNQGWTNKKKKRLLPSTEEYLKNGGKITKCKSKIMPDEIQKTKPKGKAL